MKKEQNNLEFLRFGNSNRVDSSVSPAPHFKEADIPDFPADSSTDKPKQSEIVEYRVKRKRARPRMFPVETIQNVTDYLNKKDHNPLIIPAALGIDVETSPFPIQIKALNKDIGFSGGSDIKDQKRTPTKKRKGMVIEEQIRPQDSHNRKKGRKHNTYLRIQDLIGASGGKSVEVNPTLEVNMVCDAPSLNIENLPLSKWVDGKHIPEVDISELSPVNGVEQPIEIGEKNLGDTGVFEVSKVLIPVMDKHPLALMGPQGLPFVKSSILWKTVEAMDPFQRIPQNPHFHPLQHITEGLREGEAIGYMVTFVGVVEKVYGLQFGDPKSITDNILEATAELEKQGFNVQPIMDRVSELLAVKEKEAILAGDAKEINGRILEHREQKDKVEGEIQVLNKKLQKMEQWLAVLESAKEKEEGEAAADVHRLKKTEECIVDVKREFEVIVSSAF